MFGNSDDRALRSLHPRSLKHLSDQLVVLISGRLWAQVLIAMILGLAVGVLLGPTVGLVRPELATTITNWLALPGHLFLALIQMVVIPLVFASIIRGLAASEDIDQLRKLGLIVVLYFIATSAVAITLGLWLATLIEPGRFVDSSMVQASLGRLPDLAEPAAGLPPLSQVPQALIGLLPGNPLTSMVESDMLEIVIFAMVVGAALVIMAPAQSKPLLEVLGSIQQVCMIIVRWAMRLAPLAVFGLLTQLAAKIGFEALFGMAVYVGTVLLGLLLLFVIYLLLVTFLGRRRPGAFLIAIRDLILLAFSTSSSAAVMPLTIKTAEEKLGVRPSVAQFVIPVGATLNMDGTALYQGIATIFLAQVFGIDIPVGGLVLVVITAVGASIGSPGTPGVGIVILAMVLSSVGVPTAGIALILGVDRILDMARTSVNVTGDTVASILMDRWVGGRVSVAELESREAEAVKLSEATGETVLLRQPKGG